MLFHPPKRVFLPNIHVGIILRGKIQLNQKNKEDSNQNSELWTIIIRNYSISKTSIALKPYSNGLNFFSWLMNVKKFKHSEFFRYFCWKMLLKWQTETEILFKCSLKSQLCSTVFSQVDCGQLYSLVKKLFWIWIWNHFIGNFLIRKTTYTIPIWWIRENCTSL